MSSPDLQPSPNEPERSVVGNLPPIEKEELATSLPELSDKCRAEYIKRHGDPLEGETQWREFIGLHHKIDLWRTAADNARLAELSTKVNVADYDRIWEELYQIQAKEAQREVQEFQMRVDHKRFVREQKIYERVSIQGFSAEDWKVAIGSKADVDSLRRSELGFTCSACLAIHELMFRAQLNGSLVRKDVAELKLQLKNLVPPTTQEVLGRILKQLGLRWQRSKPWALNKDESFHFHATSEEAYQRLDAMRRRELGALMKSGTALADTRELHQRAYEFTPIDALSDAHWKLAIGDRWDESHHNSELSTLLRSRIADIRDLLIRARANSGLIREDVLDLQALVDVHARQYGWPQPGIVLPEIFSQLGVVVPWGTAEEDEES